MTNNCLVLLLATAALFIGCSSLRHHCGDINHTNLTRPCRNNDTDCGEWNDRWWNPYNCHYRDVTPEQARQCVGNRTIACMGDSQIRDVCQGIVFLLLGVYNTPETMRTKKFDYHEMDVFGTIIDDVPFWKLNVPPHNHNGYIFPKPHNASFAAHKWQLQMWSLFRREFLYGKQHVDILMNKMVNKTQDLRPIDFLLWNYGLHDYGWFDSGDRGKKYFDSLIKSDYLEQRDKATMPILWTPMNNECKAKMRDEETVRDQHGMVADANYYTNQKFLDLKIPYWDTDAVLRTKDRCEHSDDGVHVNMYVDMMRAKMFFNHVCDHHWNWKPNAISTFV